MDLGLEVQAPARACGAGTGAAPVVSGGDLQVGTAGKAGAVLAGRQAEDAMEHAAKCRGVLVADCPGDLVYRTAGEFQQLARVASGAELEIAA